MFIILSQRKDIEMSYSDELYKVYHFPARYKNQISPGDVFIYYQGDRLDSSHRVYFGTGVVDSVYTTDGTSYYANLSNCKEFQNEVSIYLNSNLKYVEQIGYEAVRKSPPWQSSIRSLSKEAYEFILSKAGALTNVSATDSSIEELNEDLKKYLKGYFLGEDLNSLKRAVEIEQIIINSFENQNTKRCTVDDSVSPVQSLIDYCRSMKMSYSYKPVLVLSVLQTESFSITISKAVDYFKSFYENRRNNNQKIEKKNCIYQDSNTPDSVIYDNILSNPVNALSKSGYFEFLTDTQEFRIVPSIAEYIKPDDIKLIRSICKQKLDAYYISLGNK